ncbi:MAG: 30S ribosomal protein S1 [Deltaproteobacteria bacterium]|nr:MAG: 30S ribosomal protein S1 [Deltaproteobacteria bacterium]
MTNTETPNNQTEFALLFEESLKTQPENIQEGEIVRGTVVAITHDAVIVDFGYKSEGQVPLQEFEGPGGQVAIQVGDTLDVYLEQIDCEEGLPVLSKEKADALKIWDKLQEVLDHDSYIEGVVLNKVKGGLSVDIGVKAFLPASQIDVRTPGNLDKLIGKRFRFKILKLNKKKGNIIVSRRALLEKDRGSAREEVFNNLQEGEVIGGSVKNITDYGAFLDLGGIDGLLHITDMSWGRLGHPSEILTVGQDIKVKVLKIDPDSGKVSLGLKQLTSDPWVQVPERYPVGSRIKGKVVSLADYGAFVGLEDGIEGLVHVSEMSWSKKNKHPSKILAPGDLVEAVILDVDPATRRISLGMKQIMENPWVAVAEKYKIGEKVKGPVKNITDFGIFLGLSDDVDGLVHVSDVSWTKLARPLSAAFPKNTVVEATILSIDVDNERISLGVKQMSDDPWPRASKELGIGSRHPGKVVWIGEKGIAVDMGAGIEGFVPRTELPDEFQADPAKKFPIGGDVQVVVHSIDEKERKIQLGFVL